MSDEKIVPLNTRPEHRRPTAETEARLDEIRREAQKQGQVLPSEYAPHASVTPLETEHQPHIIPQPHPVQTHTPAHHEQHSHAGGFRVAGAPFPIASPERGYYGVPMLKQPQWTWEIPVYFFVGGAAASSAVIGAMANLTGKDKQIARDARYVAAAGTVISGALLIADLGRHERFLNMLRVFKPQSVMSMGAWTLAVFGSASGAAAALQFAHQKLGWPTKTLGNIAEVFSCLSALPFSNYTGVLIGCTVIPVWNHNVRSLPVHFGMSGLNCGTSILELMGHDHHALNLLGMGASAAETWEGWELEMLRDAEVNRPLKEGVSGWITRAGGLFSGPVPLVLRIAAEFTPKRTSRKLRRWAAISSIAGSMLTRWGWLQAGHASAKDFRLPLQLKDRPLEKSSMESIDEFPRAIAVNE